MSSLVESRLSYGETFQWMPMIKFAMPTAMHWIITRYSYSIVIAMPLLLRFEGRTLAIRILEFSFKSNASFLQWNDFFIRHLQFLIFVTLFFDILNNFLNLPLSSSNRPLTFWNTQEVYSISIGTAENLLAKVILHNYLKHQTHVRINGTLISECDGLLPAGRYRFDSYFSSTKNGPLYAFT